MNKIIPNNHHKTSQLCVTSNQYSKKKVNIVSNHIQRNSVRDKSQQSLPTTSPLDIMVNVVRKDLQTNLSKMGEQNYQLYRQTNSEVKLIQFSDDQQSFYQILIRIIFKSVYFREHTSKQMEQNQSKLKNGLKNLCEDCLNLQQRQYFDFCFYLITNVLHKYNFQLYWSKMFQFQKLVIKILRIAIGNIEKYKPRSSLQNGYFNLLFPVKANQIINKMNTIFNSFGFKNLSLQFLQQKIKGTVSNDHIFVIKISVFQIFNTYILCFGNRMYCYALIQPQNNMKQQITFEGIVAYSQIPKFSILEESFEISKICEPRKLKQSDKNTRTTQQSSSSAFAYISQIQNGVYNNISVSFEPNEKHKSQLKRFQRKDTLNSIYTHNNQDHNNKEILNSSNSGKQLSSFLFTPQGKSQIFSDYSFCPIQKKISENQYKILINGVQKEACISSNKKQQKHTNSQKRLNLPQFLKSKNTKKTDHNSIVFSPRQKMIANLRQISQLNFLKKKLSSDNLLRIDSIQNYKSAQVSPMNRSISNSPRIRLLRK